ncbi:hypothetical protein QVE09_28700 [Paenibacillus sp. ClWae2A]|uniref:hypothetical protein n=1 Tax=Paenibacillus sp. ClWae2A TaxID=3057177 RepID=UPI0028F5EAF7|nr:hypothetical protein [Paenibacillus sp. ClWae2A]MDT9722880.1 hypothetical protein [Paenibacillus sp. ClWae2A]
MIIMAVLFICAGLMFLLYPHKVTDASEKQIKERVIMSRWVGGSLIALSCLFLIMGTIQLLDQASHHIGH